LNAIRSAFNLAYSAATVLFYVCGVALVVFVGMELWIGLMPAASLDTRARFNAVLEAIGLLTIAVAALELGQTVLEEEVQRRAHMSAPTRARRFLSRFLIVVVVALSVETLVSVFQFAHSDPGRLPEAAWIGIAAAALLAAWGAFVWLNRSAEELEPEAMEHAKREDQNVD
jgi:hypothetical protein